MNTIPQLSEDNVSDLLWLVNNYGHKLKDAADWITDDELTKLTETLEAMLDDMG